MEAFLSGKKTTLLAAIGIVAAVTAGFNDWFTTHPDVAFAAGSTWVAAIFAALRAGVAKGAAK